MQKTDYALGLIGLIGFGVAGFLVYRNNQPVAQVAQVAPVEKTESVSDVGYSPYIEVMNNNPYGLLGSIAQGAIDMVSKPRGIRNNNPLNLRWNSVNNWNGQVSKDDKGFIIFDTVENGIRAAAKTLDTYSRNGYNTIEKIIARWAPAVENNVESYVSHVEKNSGINRKAIIVKSRDYVKLLGAMIKHENGQQPYSVETIAAGVALS